MASSETAASQSDLVVQTTEEIENIINEIEGLQQDLKIPESIPEQAQPSADVAVLAAEDNLTVQIVSDDELLKEFHAAGGATNDGTSMEETLASLKEEAPRADSLLAQTVADVPVAVVAAATEPPVEAKADEFPENPEDMFEDEAVAASAQKHANEEAVVALEPPTPERKPETTSAAPLHLVPAQANTSPKEVAMSESEEGTLTLTLSGSMKLKLKYQVEGQEVVVGFDDHCLKIELKDGTEFKVPIGNRTPKVKAA